MTAADLLAAEEARAMSGRPAWRVKAACVKNEHCPRCHASRGQRCDRGRPPCRERVWAQRARERAAKPIRWDLVGMFVVSTANAYRERLATGLRAPMTSLDHAIEAGLVRLSIDNGAPVWLLTEAAVDAVKACIAAAEAEPDAPMPFIVCGVDASQAAADFLARGKP